MTGSGNAWAPISADLEHDLVFVPTGSPSVDFFGGTRPGDDRDADSLVALRASTGEKVWSFQLVHHDIWDYDTPSEPVLFTFRGTIPAVAVTTKSDMVFVFNRLTGQPLYPIVERPVPASTLPGEHAWPTQPFSTLPPLAPLSYSANDIHLHDPAKRAYCVQHFGMLEYHGLFTPASIKGSLMYPGSGGGSNWGSSAFDPTTATLYTPINNLPFLVRESRHVPRGNDWKNSMKCKLLFALPQWAGGAPPPLDQNFQVPDQGGSHDEDVQWGTPYQLGREALMTPDGTPCGPEPFGAIVATDLDTGKQRWSVPRGSMIAGEPGSLGVGGVIVTAGGLLFTAASDDKQMRAYDASTGRELWHAPLPVAANATPMSYVIDGRQYVVIAAGGHVSLGNGLSDTVVAFALPPEKHDGGVRSRPRRHQTQRPAPHSF